MRTTIDLPEDLLRRAKATAALRGIKMKDLIADLVRAGLSAPPKNDDAPVVRGMRCPVPVTIPANGTSIPSMTNADIERVLLEEEMERIGLA